MLVSAPPILVQTTEIIGSLGSPPSGLVLLEASCAMELSNSEPSSVVSKTSSGSSEASHKKTPLDSVLISLVSICPKQAWLKKVGVIARSWKKKLREKTKRGKSLRTLMYVEVKHKEDGEGQESCNKMKDSGPA